ncbi:hypothetical protein [Brucella sp.]|uniref:hypothetical protein n=1 Tax=Brucella sp. TaxID=52132 RepID=UPI0028AD9187|nr:hypothetical protein [Brucella sp.]
MIDPREKTKLVNGYIKSALTGSGSGSAMSKLFEAWEAAQRRDAADEFVLALIGELIATREIQSLDAGRFRAFSPP